MKVISCTVAHAINFLKSVCLPRPSVATTRLAKIQIVKKKKLFTSWNKDSRINKQYNADFTRNPLKNIEKAVGDSTCTFNNQ